MYGRVGEYCITDRMTIGTYTCDIVAVHDARLARGGVPLSSSMEICKEDGGVLLWRK